MHMFGISDIFVVPVYPFPGVGLTSIRKFQRHLISKLPWMHLRLIKRGGWSVFPPALELANRREGDETPKAA